MFDILVQVSLQLCWINFDLVIQHFCSNFLCYANSYQLRGLYVLRDHGNFEIYLHFFLCALPFFYFSRTIAKVAL